jgi:hypothetical protein
VKRSPWKSNSRSVVQEVPRHLWNPKVQYCVPKSQPLVSILSQKNRVYNPTPCIFNIHFSNIPLFRPRSPKDLFHSVFQIYFVCISHVPRACNLHCSSHLPWCDQPNNICWTVQIMKLLIMQFSSSCCFVSPFSSLLYLGIKMCMVHVGVTACLRAPLSHVDDIPSLQFR